MRFLIDNVLIWDGADRLIENGAITIKDGKVAEFLTARERERFTLPTDTERIDGTGKLAIPGLVNAHTHLYSSLARGMGVPLQFGTAALWSRDGWETSVPEAKGAGIQFTGRVCVVPTSGIGQFQCYLGSRGW